jgi:hypothetical protein
MDRDQPASFADHLVGTLTGGALTMLISVGYRVGLFEAATPGPATSAVLAARAGLRERYVKEWPGAMVTGGFFGYDRATGQYDLPQEHARVLTGDGAANAAPVASMLRALAGARVLDVGCGTGHAVTVAARTHPGRRTASTPAGPDRARARPRETGCGRGLWVVICRGG